MLHPRGACVAPGRLDAEPHSPQRPDVSSRRGWTWMDMDHEHSRTGASTSGRGGASPRRVVSFTGAARRRSSVKLEAMLGDAAVSQGHSRGFPRAATPGNLSASARGRYCLPPFAGSGSAAAKTRVSRARIRPEASTHAQVSGHRSRRPPDRGAGVVGRRPGQRRSALHRQDPARGRSRREWIPLSGDNPLIFSAGPFAGTNFSNANRTSIGLQEPAHRRHQGSECGRHLRSSARTAPHRGAYPPRCM